MRSLNFAKRSFKEIARDPLSVIFALLLPLFLLFVFSQLNIPSEVYNIENFTPGILIFSFAFVSMFTATLVARDRCTSLLVRLGVSPMKSRDYVIGYALAVMPLVLAQNILFFTAALLMGLDLTVSILWTALASMPISVLFVFLGILIGSLTAEKSSAGASSIVVQLVAFTSGMYFDSGMMGGFFDTVCRVLPFSSCLTVLKTLLNSTDTSLAMPIISVCIYTALTVTASVYIFNINMKKG